MVKDSTGFWTVTTDPLVCGNHYYFLTIDGSNYIDPSSKAVFGCGKMCGTIDIDVNIKDNASLMARMHGATMTDEEIALYQPNANAKRGQVRECRYWSSVENRERRCFVYTPASYDKNVKAENVVDGRTYYKGAQTATVRVKEKYFYPEDATIEVEAKAFKLNDDLTAEPIEVTDAYTISEWQEDPEDPLYHFATVEFNADANYEIKVNYTDKCKYSDDYENKLTVDTTVPKLVKTEIDKPLSQLILSGLTLGFYKANVNVTLTYFDAVAGVCTFESEGAKAEGKYISEINSQFEKQTLDVTSEKGITVVSFTLLEKAAEEITDADNFDSLINAHVTDRSNNTTEKETVSKNTKEDGISTTRILTPRSPLIIRSTKRTT